MMKLKARLTKAYGSEEGFLRHQMDLEDVQRKLEVRFSNSDRFSKVQTFKDILKHLGL